MTTEPIKLDDNPIATLNAAAARDTTLNSPGMGELSQVGAALCAPLPYDRDKSLKARQSTVAVAIEEFPPTSKFGAAIKAAADLHERARRVGLKVRDMFGDQVKHEYRRIHLAATSRMMAGDASAFDGIEAESAIATRFQAQIDACQASMGTLGFQQVEHAAVIRDELDRALGKLVAKLKADDIASAKRYGVEADFSAETRIAASVRVLHARATIFLKALEKATAGNTGGNFQLVRNTFRDFLPEVDAWK